ncbi:hypothetical protein [Rubinisphaera italica]|uniref:Uncharacterized protein n=1 Tax=Rubinisphaera italica TaxID=2527969 RepID=A0A5C5XD99_9PLAN|nr:hypothetical protein [Rubinisphaera italica]TWT60970.1 hypothetical protein Pan54_17020 [Rubinisphaera italica]
MHRLVNSFSSIPGRWIERIDESITWVPIWGTVFLPTNSIDVQNIEEMLKPIAQEEDSGEYIGGEWQEVGDTGILAAECDGELILGINGAGYDFYTDHWAKLYNALGYHWHTPIESS